MWDHLLRLHITPTHYRHITAATSASAHLPLARSIPTRSTALSDGDKVSRRLAVATELSTVCQHLGRICKQKQIFSHSAPPASAGWEEAVHNRLILIDISIDAPPPHPPPPSALSE